MSTNEMEKYRNKDRQEEAGTCIMGELRKDREKGLPNDAAGLIDHYRHEVRKGQEAYDELLKEVNMLRGTKQIVERLSGEFKKMKKRAQEAETETILVKGIGINSPEMKDAKAKIKEIEMGLANALAVNESHQKLNGKLQERLTELEQENIELQAENKKMSNHLEKQVDNARKSGM
jgi:hypothetical protein